MKSILLFVSFLAILFSSLFGLESKEDFKTYIASSNCFNAFDKGDFNVSIQTKKEAPFILFVTRSCPIEGKVYYQLWDMSKDKNLTPPKILRSHIIYLNPKIPARDVRVKFTYNTFIKTRFQEIPCSSKNFKKVKNLISGQGLVYLNGKCFNTNPGEDYSTDNFAILPKFELATDAKFVFTRYPLKVKSDSEYDWKSVNSKSSEILLDSFLIKILEQ